MTAVADSGIAVLGAGSWGTALALVLARNGHSTRLWGHHRDHIEQMRNDRENRRYLPGSEFPENLSLTASLAKCVANAGTVMVVVPSHAFGETLTMLKPLISQSMGITWATKGLEHGSGRFLHEVTADILGTERPVAVASGPSFAREVAVGLPTAITVASGVSGYAAHIAALLHGRGLRAYSSNDVIGVELGGALKNVLAIAAGVADGLGFGANARAALITRGLAEMVRLGEAVGGKRDTFMGLAGIGDLVLTCTDDQSRNRRFGLAIGRGHSAEQAQRDIGQVVEGAATAREMMSLASEHGVEMPITEQVERVLSLRCDARQAVETLLSRDPKPENN